MSCSTRESVRTDGGRAGLPEPDRPERIVVPAAGGAAAFVIPPGKAGPAATTGIWYGPLAGQPARISDVVPDTNLAFAPGQRELAFGVQPPNVSWGTIVNNGQALLYTRPWVSLAPGIMIVLTVLSLNVLGDGVRDALDPRAKLRVG